MMAIPVLPGPAQFPSMPVFEGKDVLPLLIVDKTLVKQEF